MSSPTASNVAATVAQVSDHATDIVVRVENVSVRYQIPSERIRSLKGYIIRKLQGRIRNKAFWALNDVSLSVNDGEVFGLVGPNGAGKSTLLKLIARILIPTKGRIWVKGHVAPLLGIGAGFHPELTGRENVYLNGALLGFTHHEMEEKFENIVNFAELWDFIDVPMRTYSTGMWARMGFAVATEVDPDILIIDEVLSVGDEAFRRKSSARIQEFRERGTTILLVSHNMPTIREMCHRVAWLDQGRLQLLSEPADVIRAYRQHKK